MSFLAPENTKRRARISEVCPPRVIKGSVTKCHQSVFHAKVHEPSTRPGPSCIEFKWEDLHIRPVRRNAEFLLQEGEQHGAVALVRLGVDVVKAHLYVFVSIPFCIRVPCDCGKGTYHTEHGRGIEGPCKHEVLIVGVLHRYVGLGFAKRSCAELTSKRKACDQDVVVGEID
jgi:hypothetical protein